MSSSTYDPPADRPLDMVLDELCFPPDLDEPDGWDDFWADCPEAWSYAEAAPHDGGTPTDPVDPALAACAQIGAGLDALATLPGELVGHESVLAVVAALMAGRSRTAGLLARYVRQVSVRSLYPPTWAGDPTATYLRTGSGCGRSTPSGWLTGRRTSCRSCRRSGRPWSTGGPTRRRPTLSSPVSTTCPPPAPWDSATRRWPS